MNKGYKCRCTCKKTREDGYERADPAPEHWYTSHSVEEYQPDEQHEAVSFQPVFHAGVAWRQKTEKDF